MPKNDKTLTTPIVVINLGAPESPHQHYPTTRTLGIQPPALPNPPAIDKQPDDRESFQNADNFR
jgi:hypothetical protein